MPRRIFWKWLEQLIESAGYCQNLLTSTSPDVQKALESLHQVYKVGDCLSTVNFIFLNYITTQVFNANIESTLKNKNTPKKIASH
jgi:hypothetical protein